MNVVNTELDGPTARDGPSRGATLQLERPGDPAPPEPDGSSSSAIRVLFVTEDTWSEHTVADLGALRTRRDGFIWVDIPECHEADVDVGTVFEVFGFHERDIRSCMRRNHVQKVHSYDDHLFFVLFGPKVKTNGHGHVHFVELSQFVGQRYLVTVHAFNEDVSPEEATKATTHVYSRITSEKLRVHSPWHISCEIVKNMTMRMEDFIECCSRQVWQLQQCVMERTRDVEDSPSFKVLTATAGEVDCTVARDDSKSSPQPHSPPGSRRRHRWSRDSEPFLEALFRIRHGLLAVRSMAALSEEVYGRLMNLSDHKPSEREPLLDVAKRFKLLEASAAIQQDYLQGVVDHYRARTDTKRTIAAMTLAVIAVVTLPVTTLSSIYGMNIINNQHSDFRHLAVVLALMAGLCAILLVCARRMDCFPPATTDWPGRAGHQPWSHGGSPNDRSTLASKRVIVLTRSPVSVMTSRANPRPPVGERR
jgi:Mg2+ and Co2+ transporter CorA